MVKRDKDILHAVAEEAAEWYLLLEEDTVTESARQDFVNWLKRASINIEEFMRVGAMQQYISETPLTELPNIQALIEEARSNVVKISGTPTKLEQIPAINAKKPEISISTYISSVSRRLLIGSIAATILIGTTTVLWLSGDFSNSANIIETGLGEQRSAVLPDGSVVNLNTQSKLMVRYSDHIRLVELTSGEAMFDVSKNHARPFRVKVGATLVEAIGTQFNVYRQNEKTVVTVVEGQVAVSSKPIEKGRNSATNGLKNNHNDQVVHLEQGHQVAVSVSGSIAEKTAVYVKNTTAWTTRRLVFDGDSLDVVVRELNRYNAQKLIIGDPHISQRAINGVFNANDPETLVAFLSEVGGLHVQIEPGNRGWTLSAKPDNREAQKK